MFSRKNFVISLSVLSFGLSGCQETDADKVGDAQLCIDKATPTSVSSCLAKIEGIDTPAANVLRCSAGFIEEGFDQANRLIDSLDQLKAGGGGTTALMGLIAFKSKTGGALNKAFAVATSDYCQKSDQKSLALLGTLAMTATSLASIAFPGLTEGQTVTENDIKTVIDNLLAAGPGDATAIAAVSEIGNAVSATYQIACAASSSSDAKMCKEIVDTMNNSGVDINDPKAVGDKILELWKANTGS